MATSPQLPRIMLSGSKAAATASMSKTQAVLTSSSSAQQSSSSTRHHARTRSSSVNLHRCEKSGGVGAPADAISDRATTAFIYRVLCRQSSLNGSNQSKPLEELLPPLSSSNEVDLQLYALIAIIIKEFVYSWYSKITPDHAFADELVQIIAHCTRALEQRLRRVDIDALILDELPALLDAHIYAFRTAARSSVEGQGSYRFHTVYHTLNPHPAFEPVPDPTLPFTTTSQKERETIYRQLMAQGVLAILLPTEDLENVCLRTILCDILADMILGEVISDKVCKNYSIWDYLTKLAALIQKKKEPAQGNTVTAEAVPKSQLEKFGLLSEPSSASDGSGQKTKSSTSHYASALSAMLWSFLQYLYLAFVAARFTVLGLYRVYTAPKPKSAPRGTDSARPASRPATPLSTTSSVSPCLQNQASPRIGGVDTEKAPMLAYRLFSMTSSLLGLRHRMPWFESTLAFVQHMLLEGPGHLGATDGVFDRFLHELVQTHVLTAELIPIMLSAARATLFPGNRRPAKSPAMANVPRQSAHSSSSSISSTTGAPPPVSTAGSTKVQANSSAAAQGLTRQSSQLFSTPSQTLVEDAGPGRSSVATHANSVRRRCAIAILALVPHKLAMRFFCPEIAVTDKQGHHAHLASSPSSPSVNAEESSAQTSTSPIPQISLTTTQQDPATDVPTTNPAEELLLQAVEKDVLDLFSDEYCNKHLIFSAIETILTKLMPELAQHSVGELMAERGL